MTAFPRFTAFTVLFLAFVCGSGAPPAFAQAADVGGIVKDFAKDSFTTTNTAVNALATSGDPRAATILEALNADHLLFSPSTSEVVIESGSQVMDAASGKAVTPPPADLKHVRLNNRVRGALGAAMASVLLSSSDPAKRTQAANSLLRARDRAALPAVTVAEAKEAVPSVKVAMATAKGALVALDTSATEPDRIAGLKLMSTASGYDALAVIDQVLAGSSGALKTAAESAKSSVQFRLSLWGHARDALYGLSLGSVLLLASIGLAITFGVMGVINMAHGEMVMIGAYTTYVLQGVLAAHAPGWSGASLLLAVPVAFVVAGAVGVAIERSVIRFLYGRPLETLLATWGVSLILQQAVRTAFGPDNRPVSAPAFMAGSFHLGGLEITSGRMWIVVFTLLVFVALQLVLRATPFGLRMRAVTQNRRMASAMGISTGRIDALAFGLGSGIAGIAGVALTQIDNVSPNLGQNYIIDSFMVVVFGGVGNLWGTLVAALGLGIADKFLEPFAGAVLAKIAILVFIVLFIQRKPRGLFALKGRAVEA